LQGHISYATGKAVSMPEKGDVKVEKGKVYRWNGKRWEPITGPEPLRDDPREEA
jgi:hypothetical protein